MRKGLSSSIKLDLITDHKSEQPQELPLLCLHQTHSTGQSSTPTEKQGVEMEIKWKEISTSFSTVLVWCENGWRRNKRVKMWNEEKSGLMSLPWWNLNFPFYTPLLIVERVVALTKTFNFPPPTSSSSLAQRTAQKKSENFKPFVSYSFGLLRLILVPFGVLLLQFLPYRTTHIVLLWWMLNDFNCQHARSSSHCVGLIPVSFNTNRNFQMRNINIKTFKVDELICGVVCVCSVDSFHRFSCAQHAHPGSLHWLLVDFPEFRILWPGHMRKWKWILCVFKTFWVHLISLIICA